MTSAHTLDALGTFCPVPVQMLARVAGRMPGGTHIVLLADDPLVKVDVPAWCHSHGHSVMSIEADPSGGWRLTVLLGGTQ